MISTGPCRPSCRNISSRILAAADRHGYPAWADERPRLIAPTLRAAMRDETNEIAVSAATIWEIAIKRAIGKLRFDRPTVAAVLALGFEILPVAGAHADHAGSLPPHHNDPFDRLIIAQAYLEGMVLGTQDRRLQPYGVMTLGLN